MRQLPLDFPHRVALGREKFVVGAANRDAVAWIDRWPDWPGGGVFVYGPSGAGKSHLIEVWRTRSMARRLTPPDLAALDPALFAIDRAVAFDQIDGPLGGEAERNFLHVYNMLRANLGTVLIAAREPPLAWTQLPDLASRLATLATVCVAAPDDDLLMAVVRKQFADRQVEVAEDVLRYILTRIERSFAANGAVVAALDRAAIEAKRPITIGLVRAVLEDERPTPDLLAEIGSVTKP